MCKAPKTPVSMSQQRHYRVQAGGLYAISNKELSSAQKEQIEAMSKEILEHIAEEEATRKPLTPEEYAQRVTQLDAAGLDLVHIKLRQRPLWVQKKDGTFATKVSGGTHVRLMWLDEYGRRCTRFITVGDFNSLFEEAEV